VGTAALGGLYSPTSVSEAAAMLRAALDEGIRYFDTAPMYGLSSAERRLGAALAEADGPLDRLVSTKVGRLMRPARLVEAPLTGAGFGWRSAGPFVEHYDYSYDGIFRSIEDSLQRTGLDHFDVVFIHDIGELTHGADNDKHLAALRVGGYRALGELRLAGVARAVGVGVNEISALLTCLSEMELDVALLAGRFTLLEQPPSDDVYERCAEHGVQLVAGGALNSGVLAGGEHYDYAAAPPRVRRRVDELRVVCAAHGVSLLSAALQFVSSNPNHACVLIGPRTEAELQQNLAALREPVPSQLWDELVERGLIPGRWRPSTKTGVAR
jgi:D-threo-aldose 1-dehydrogenase